MITSAHPLNDNKVLQAVQVSSSFATNYTKELFRNKSWNMRGQVALEHILATVSAF